MNLFYKFIFFILITTKLYTMEQHSAAAADSFLEELAPGLKTMIFEYLSQASKADNLREVFKNLAQISMVNKDFYNWLVIQILSR